MRDSVLFEINGNHAFISQIYRVVGPMGEKLDFFTPLGFEAKSEFHHKPLKLKPRMIRASKRYLNHNNPINGREMASISWFSAETCKVNANEVTWINWPIRSSFRSCWAAGKMIVFSLAGAPLSVYHDATRAVNLLYCRSPSLHQNLVGH